MNNHALNRIVESTLIPHTAYADVAARLRQCLKYADRSPEPICFAIVGESRTGKSRILEECEQEHPPKRTSEGLEVPILRVSAPSKPSAKSLAEVMLEQLGDPKWESGTENNKTARLKKLLKACGTRMLMIDEFQHFFDKTTQKVFHHVADWLKVLADATRIALVVTGLESCLPVLLRNEQLSGRFLAPAFMHRFNWLDDDHRDDFKDVLAAFGESLSAHVQLPDLSSDEMSFRLWCATGGLMGYLTKLLRQLIWDAEDDGRRSISLADFDAAHNKAIWTVDVAAQAMTPFEKSFSPEPTQEMVSLALAVGVRDESTTQTKPSRGSKKSKADSASRHLCSA